MKTSIDISILLFFFTSNVFSQQSAIDSLKTEFYLQSNDTLKIKSLQKISQLFLIEYPDSSMYYYVSDAYDLISNVYENQGQLENK